MLQIPLEALAPADQFFRALILDERGEYAQAKVAADVVRSGMYTPEYLGLYDRVSLLAFDARRQPRAGRDRAEDPAAHVRRDALELPRDDDRVQRPRADAGGQRCGDQHEDGRVARKDPGLDLVHPTARQVFFLDNAALTLAGWRLARSHGHVVAGSGRPTQPDP